MNLGQLIALETIWHLNISDDPNTPEYIKKYLQETKGLEECQIDFAFSLYEMAKERFSKEEWEKAESLLKKNEEARIYFRQGKYDEGMEILGNILWEMGQLFGTNLTDPDAIH